MEYTIFDFGLLHLEWPNALFVFVVFAITTIGLHFFLFNPILHTIKNRKNMQQNQQSKINNIKKEIESLEFGIIEKKREFDAKLSKHRKQNIEEANLQAERIINDSRQDSQQRLAKFEKTIAGDIKIHNEYIKQITPEIKRAIVNKILS